MTTCLICDTEYEGGNEWLCPRCQDFDIDVVWVCPRCGDDMLDEETCPNCGEVDELDSVSYPADELAFATDTLIGEIEAVEEECPDCGAGCLWKRQIRRDGELITEVLCEKCEYYRNDSNWDDK